MGITSNKVMPDAAVAFAPLHFTLPATSTGQTDLEVREVRPGFNFQIVKAECHCTAYTATASVNVLIGSTSALASAITPAAGNVVQGTLSTTMANRRGNTTDNIVVQYTTNGSGVITNGSVTVWIRPFPMNGEVMPLAGL